MITFSSIHRSASIDLPQRCSPSVGDLVFYCPDFLNIPCQAEVAPLLIPQSMFHAMTWKVSMCQVETPESAFSICFRRRFEIHHIRVDRVSFVHAGSLLNTLLLAFLNSLDFAFSRLRIFLPKYHSSPLLWVQALLP